MSGIAARISKVGMAEPPISGTTRLAYVISANLASTLLVVGQHAADPLCLPLGHPDRQFDEPIRPALVRQPLLRFPQLRFAILGCHGGNGNRLALIRQDRHFMSTLQVPPAIPAPWAEDRVLMNRKPRLIFGAHKAMLLALNGQDGHFAGKTRANGCPGHRQPGVRHGRRPAPVPHAPPPRWFSMGRRQARQPPPSRFPLAKRPVPPDAPQSARNAPGSHADG